MPKDENPPQGFKYIDNTTRVTINDVIDNNWPLNDVINNLKTE